MRPEQGYINWTYPPPKNGLDTFIGPGATRAELLLQVIVPTVFTVGLVGVALLNQWGWTPVQLLVAGLLMFDMVGGVVTNATSTAKRWYHRNGQGFREHMMFVVIHVAQPALIMLFFDRWNWLFLLGSYGYLLLAALVTLQVPLYLQRPIAGIWLVLGFFLSLYWLPIPVHFEWFLPVFYTKLLSSHLLQEEPYRPANESAQ
jgi:hypothetical protein